MSLENTLERIAVALEAIAANAGPLLQAEPEPVKPVKAKKTRPETTPAPADTPPVVEEAPPVEPEPVSASPSEPEPAPEPTQEDVRAAAIAWAKAHNKESADIVMFVKEHFGVRLIAQLEPTHYAEAIALFKEHT